MKRTIFCLLLCASSLAAQTGAKNGEWKTYGGDLGNTHYSPLDQINASNFNSLQIAWRFKTDNLGAQPEFNLESTPLMVNGVLYSTAGTRRAVVAIDARTGRRLWIFHTIPLPNEYGAETWENNSASYTGNTGVWGQISVDEELGMVFLPVELPTGDYYGGHRPGNGLFGESVVALDLKTGARKWHYQLVHHGIWDMDIPDAPMLVDITVNGQTIKALAQPTKQAILYVFNRQTGQPIWPFEERSVEKGTVPGEWYAATQPFPTKPPAYDLHGFTVGDIIDFTPELQAEGLKIASRYKPGPIFTPPVVSKWEDPLATMALSPNQSGSNWAGSPHDPETHIDYIPSQR